MRPFVVLTAMLVFAVGCVYAEPLYNAARLLAQVSAARQAERADREPRASVEPTCELSAVTLEELRNERAALNASLRAERDPAVASVISGQLLGLQILEDAIREWRADHSCNPI